MLAARSRIEHGRQQNKQQEEEMPHSFGNGHVPRFSGASLSCASGRTFLGSAIARPLSPSSSWLVMDVVAERRPPAAVASNAKERPR
jgi:hypothetical protein